jgi:Rho termination factor-like protein
MRFLFLGVALGVVLAFLLRKRDAVRGMLDQTPLNTGRASNLEDMTKDELYERAQKADIPGRSEMTKSELIKALRLAS